MKAAILISTLPTELHDTVIQHADKYGEYEPATWKMLSVIEAKMAMRSPDQMEGDENSREDPYDPEEV